ncbi:MAG: hypothetical protein R3199_08455 [Gemmatimonadota bacterium]|nr:hypothetical protein [Gemmatimonadota bacterium]
MSAPLVLVDPDREPFWPCAATRPVADLLAGTRPFHARWADRHGPVASVVCDGAVAEAPSRISVPPPRNTWPGPEGGWRVALSCWVPRAGWTFPGEPAEIRVGGSAVGWRIDEAGARELADDPPASPAAARERLADLGLPPVEAEGVVCDTIWATMAANPELLVTDAPDFEGEDAVAGVDPFALLGDPADLEVGAGVAIGPFVELDVRDGPIVLDRGVRIDSHSRLRGPLYVGPDSRVLGGAIGEGTSIGPRCKVRGEMEQTLVHGFSNKAHAGFVGHSVLGEWVNLGAGTITSDLKNTYGPVRVERVDGRTDTGLIKVGAFLGDHVKTGIGTLLATGVRIGVGTHLFGGRGVSPRRLPDFSWHDGRERSGVEWEPFERSARRAMARREESLGEAELAMLRALHAGAGSAAVRR